MSGYTLKHGRAATPAPVDPRYTRLKELAKALEKEAKVHRDDADTLERFGDLMQDRDRLVRSWVAWKLDEYASGNEYLDTLTLNGKTLKDIEEQEAQ